MKWIRRQAALILTAALLITGTDYGTNSAMAEESGHLIINQIYGGGGKGETPITNSFVELYNPTDAEVSLDGYSLVCGTDTLTLASDAKIAAKQSYLVVCNLEQTSDEWITYDLPAADQNWEYTISNKAYTFQLKNETTVVDEATATKDVDNLAISKQKSLRRIDYQDTDSASDWEIIIWEKGSTVVDQNFIEKYAPHNGKGEIGNVHIASEVPEYTPVQTGDTKVQGVNNGNSTLDMELFARYNSQALSADGGSLEIVEYNSKNGYAYAVSGLKGKIIAVKVSDVKNGEKVADLNGTEYDVSELVSGVSGEGFVYGDITSVSISPDGTKLAAAVQHADYDKEGVVAVFTCNADGSLTNPKLIKTGVQPDMVVFVDDNIALTADEGEPRNGYDSGVVDPAGSVSVLNIEEGTSEQIGFESFSAEELIAKNILLGVANDTVISPEKDLEPEYIAVSSDGKKAYVSLQEANAIAVLDIAKKQFTGIYSVGFEDYSKVAVDLVKDGKYEAATYENLVGARMPDGITLYENGKKTYLLTANEGDSREWGSYVNEAKDKSFTGESIRVLDSACCAGLPDEKTVMFGGRSFSVFEVTENGLQEVFDSGNDFEKITAQAYGNFFNCSNDDNEIDSRSAKKGPEPEYVTLGKVNGRTYAFVGLERIGGVIVYDVTDPAKSVYVNYINSREYDTEIQGDVSPEGLCFVASNQVGKPMLLAACEVSGTLAAYELTGKDSADKEPEQTPEQKPDNNNNQISEQKPDNNVTNTPSKKEQITKKKVTLKKPVIKVKAGKKKVTVTIKKVKNAKFYQVKIKIGKKWKTYKSKKRTITIKKLKKKKVYQIKVRAVTKNGEKTIYSSYSKVKRVKVK
ncbi:MAG: choice-of-anchor I family protein [Butyribacter sp.]|nr:choice-of-anchor I family protein [Butyribacter sp.]